MSQWCTALNTVTAIAPGVYNTQADFLVHICYAAGSGKDSLSESALKNQVSPLAPVSSVPLGHGQSRRVDHLVHSAQQRCP